MSSNDNASPGMIMPVIVRVEERESRRVEGMKWGLGYYKSFNARSEEIEEKPSFRQAFIHRRCLVPANGFYEWHEKIPYWISLKNQEAFGFAGIYENMTFSIVTTKANEAMSDIHDRMPVILQKENEEKWLDNTKYDLPNLKRIMEPYPDNELEITKITAATWRK